MNNKILAIVAVVALTALIAFGTDTDPSRSGAVDPQDAYKARHAADVVAELRARDASHLTPAQRANRERNLVLLAAYGDRKEQQSARYTATASRRVEAKGKAYFDEQVAEFERVQSAHKAKARARDQLAGTQVVVKRIQVEQAKRDAERDKMMLFLRRAFSVEI